jgi:hypothetical protein
LIPVIVRRALSAANSLACGRGYHPTKASWSCMVRSLASALSRNDPPVLSKSGPGEDHDKSERLGGLEPGVGAPAEHPSAVAKARSAPRTERAKAAEGAPAKRVGGSAATGEPWRSRARSHPLRERARHPPTERAFSASRVCSQEKQLARAKGAVTRPWAQVKQPPGRTASPSVPEAEEPVNDQVPCV